jgi:deazaflavin-dependent oxidoreductase (nitroreductase family)
MNALTPLAVKIGSIEWMPKLLPQITATDKFVQRISRGRVTLLDVAGLPNVMLTVKGRKSGVPRTTPLLCVPHEGDILIAGSYFGGPKTPVWVANVRAADEVQVRFKGRTSTAVPRELTGEERARYFEIMKQTWPNFSLYERRTDRTIPVFLLELQA